MNKEDPVKPKGGRKYHSPVREQQAGATKKSIALAARKLLLERGFDATTIAAIANEAGVSSQTVYAIFGSKTGILRELMNLARFGPSYREQIAKVLAERVPELRLRLAAGIARHLFESERAELDLWRGAGVLSRDFVLMEQEHEELRFTNQAPMVEMLIETKLLKPELDRKTAREILWALTSRDLFRMLVMERGWTGERYEQWLGEMLVTALTVGKRGKKRS